MALPRATISPSDRVVSNNRVESSGSAVDSAHAQNDRQAAAQKMEFNGPS